MKCTWNEDVCALQQGHLFIFFILNFFNILNEIRFYIVECFSSSRMGDDWVTGMRGFCGFFRGDGTLFK